MMQATGQLLQLTWAAPLFLMAALSPRAALGSGLEVVPAPDPNQGVFELVRGEARTFRIEVRNGDAEALAVASLFYRSDEGQSASVSPPSAIGLDGISLAPGQATTVALVVPAHPVVASYSGGLYLKPQTGPDPAQPFYRFTIKVHEAAGDPLSRKKAGWLASLLAGLVLVLTLYVRGRAAGGEKVNFFQSPSGVYSVSRFQVWLWTVVIIFSYGYLFLSQGTSPAFPDSIWALLGISMASIGAATSLAARRPPAPGGAPTPQPPATSEAAIQSPPPQQNPVVSMLSEKGTPSIMRLQMIAWTIAAVVFFVKHVYSTGLLWDVPANLLILMGISHGGYLADKAAGRT